MKFAPFTLLLLLGLLTGCSSFRPVTSAGRNASRAPRSERTVQRTPQREALPRDRRPTTTVRITRAPQGAVRQNLVSGAEKLMGIRYKYGGNTPREGFDCSGFVKYLYNDQGLDIHRVSRDQAKQGQVIKAKDAQAGDLVFYRRGANQPVFHVSMVVAAAPGEIWVIHPTSSRGVIRENILASSYWRPKIYTVKRLIN